LAQLDWIGPRRVGGQPDVDTGKLLEQAGGWLDWRVYARLNVRCADAIAIAVEKHAEDEATRYLIEPEPDGRAARYRLRARKRETGGQVSGRGMAAGVIEAGHRLRQRDARERRDERGDGGQLD